MLPLPLVGITADIADYDWQGQPRPRAQSALAYARAVAEAGGLPVILAPIPSLARSHVERCDAIIMTGGDDPRMDAFAWSKTGTATHAKANPMHPLRQEYELALLAALDELRLRPALGICLGMQLMSLHAGRGFTQYHQCLAEVLPTHEQHVKDHPHTVRIDITSRTLPATEGPVASNHRQAVAALPPDGPLRVIATAPDGVIEAVEDPSRPFYLGVQWHPERTAHRALGAAIFEKLIAAARA